MDSQPFHTSSQNSFNLRNIAVTNGQIRTVSLLIFIIFIGIFSVYSLTFHLTGDLSSFHNLQLSASLLAGIAAIMSLIKFYTRRDDKYLFIGIGFLGAALLKGLQSIPEPELVFGHSARLLVMASQEGWGFSRFFLAIMLSVSLLPWFLDRYFSHKVLNQTRLYTILLVSFSFIFLSFVLVPLSSVRFIESYASTLLTFSLVGYLLKGLWKQKYFEFCLVLGILIAIIAGIIQIAPQSASQDFFVLSQLLETLGYAFAVIGLLISMYIAYKEVEEAKDNTDAILKSIGDGVFVVDNQGILILMNKIAEQLSGASAHESIGKHYHNVFKFGYEENPQKPFPHLVEKILSNQEYREDNTNHPMIQNTRGITPILLTASAVKDHIGKIVGCVVVMTDMSKLRELERSKDNFLSLAAHQLGTPMGAVRWYTQMLLSGDMGKISPKVKDTMEQIEENNQRMVDLVNKLLDVSRIDQKSVKESPQKVSLEELIEQVIKNLKTHAFQKKVTVGFTPPQSPATSVTIDPDLLREVITNLVANAIKYNKTQGTVHIFLEEQSNSFIFTIKDTGIGIPASDQDKIYSKFFRAGNARTKVTDGTGLGLFVAKSYLEGWGGEIDFSSKEGEGTTFIVTLPKKPNLHTLSAHLIDFDQKTSVSPHLSASKKK
jgi:PAS domain S-box-containing protein